MDERSKSELSAAMQRLTDLENPNSVQQMKQWLAKNGLETDSLDKKAVAEFLKTAPEPLRKVLTLRQQLARSSVKKYTAMENAVCKDSRARGMFRFYGGNRTGRYSGKIIQLQNLPQNHMTDLAQARELVRDGNYEALSLLYEDIPDTLSQLIRTAFVPQEGRKLIVADFSAIEARVIAWFAGERWRLKVFEDGGDIYCASASQMFHVPVEKHGVNGHLRQKGKIAELALGYGGSVGALKSMGALEIKTVRGILRPAFQMAVDDDVLHKNPFSFELATVVVNDSVTREAITKDQMRKFLKFVHDDNVYCKYYEMVYILFHTGMRISEFCGLTHKDVDLENRIINIDHQLQRTSDMRLIIESTKTNAGTRKLPMTEDVFRCFQAIVEDREKPRFEKMVDGYTGFLFLDKEGLPEVAMHWEHRFNHMVKRYNDIFRVQMPNITPHVCRHTYCSNMAKAGMNPKTLQYLMGHSDISVTLNTYTHLGLEDAADELKRMEELANARKGLEKVDGEKTVSQKMFRAI